MQVLSLATGFFLGVRHCLEPDHLTAVAHFASAARTSRDGLRSGLLWGLGHAAAVLVVGFALMSVQGRFGGMQPLAERAVGGTLIALSIWRLRTLRRRPHVHPHAHDGGLVHAHAHTHEKSHGHVHAPTLTGLVHGAAGALGMVALLSVTPTGVSVGLLAAAFAVGTLVAMGATGWLAARLYSSAAAAGWERPAVALTACGGFVLGIVWIARA
jgi:ABC-type nickel/cobalt efflux system permease component RcnA